MEYRGEHPRIVVSEGAVLGEFAATAGAIPPSESLVDRVASSPKHTVVDAHIDDVGDLLRRNAHPSLDDPHAVLRHALGQAGPSILDGLPGEYAIAHWDPSSRQLTLARDPLGIRPLYYYRTADGLIFATDLRGLEAGIGRRLPFDRRVLTDYLLLGYNHYPESTVLESVRRVRGAHRLVFGHASVIATTCHWSLPAIPPLSLPDQQEALTSFVTAFEAAVRHAVRGAPAVSVDLSAGLDSTAVAAFAATVQGAPRPKARTVAARGQPGERTRELASMLARHLGLNRQDYDEGHPEDPPNRLPKQASRPIAMDRTSLRILEDQADRGPAVHLTGEGGDMAFTPEMGHPLHLIRTLQWRRLLSEAMAYRRLARQWPPLYLRFSLLARRQRRQYSLAIGSPPRWISRDALDSLVLDARRRSILTGPPVRVGAGRRTLRQHLESPIWERVASDSDPGVWGIPGCTRHPFLDIRVIEAADRLSPIPWCVGKAGLREMLSGRVPERIRTLPKQILDYPPEMFGPSPAVRRSLVEESQLAREGLVDHAALRELSKRIDRAANIELDRIAACEAWLNHRS